MNLSQRKLNKSEWESVEIPVSQDEKTIINMIKTGYSNLNCSYNPAPTIMNILKIENNITNERYIYNYYLKDRIDKLISQHKLSIKIESTVEKKKISKINIMRIENNSKEVIKNEAQTFEYTLLDIIGKILKYKKTENYRWCVYFYTLCKLIHYDIYQVNSLFIDFTKYIIDKFRNDVEFTAIIAKAKEFIECNQYLLKYSPSKLYQHQKDIISIFKNKTNIPSSRLVLYVAPTATGKTLTPIALSEGYRIIFVCAARHVGVALAKSAISVGKKIAFAFGCSTPDDIRLHYFAAKTYERHWKSGSIKKVDNSDGVNVEIMICDIKSYLCAMRYMMSFNSELNQTNDDLILFWDEPTITLDYENHECHDIIAQNWRENEIPNIILSSATLPSQDEISDTVNDFIEKFDNPSIHSITSNECKKSIQLFNSNGDIVLPHLQFENFKDVKECISYCSQYKTIYRYLDLHEISRFIVHINDDYDLQELSVDRYFDSIEQIDMETIKEYYFRLLNSIPESDWSGVFHKFKDMDKTRIPKNKKHTTSNGMYVTTCDAFTLTDGPTIFIAEDVEKIAKFCIQQSKIPQQTLNVINEDIQFNNTINKSMLEINKKMEDLYQRDIDAGNEKKIEKEIPEARNLRKKIDELSELYREVTIDNLYVPNSLLHQQKWLGDSVKNCFTSSISNTDVQRIIELSNIDDIWKILLLMGIGLFSKDNSIEYTEIVKEFADSQKLYLIIANGDYIYGTNYQFCHSYIGKDLDITQEKIIQAMGRVGRNKLQQEYSVRLRNDDVINKIFIKETDKIEIKNMNLLFVTT